MKPLRPSDPESPSHAARALERALLSLDGLSLGDAFGETFFTDEAAQRVRGQRLSDGPWRWTDDTAMAVSIVETLGACGTVDQDDLAGRLAARYAEDPARGYGPAMHGVLSDIRAGRHWRPTASSLFSGQGSFGNGAAMRASVVGAFFAEDPEEVVKQTRLSAQVTHAHAEAIAGAVAIALATALACQGPWGPSGRDFIEAVLNYLPDSEVRVGVQRALTLSPAFPIERAVEVLGNGTNISAQDTVPLALWCAAQQLVDFRAALWLTVSALGDRDTTCAMVGGIVACRVGREGLPADWLARRERLPLTIAALRPRAAQPAATPTPPPAGVIAEAKHHPGGWVYKIEGDFGPEDHVPVQAIAGAWQVDEHGVITGEFQPNPGFEPGLGPRLVAEHKRGRRLGRRRR